jgi:hypothetical protein
MVTNCFTAYSIVMQDSEMSDSDTIAVRFCKLLHETGNSTHFFEQQFNFQFKSGSHLLPILYKETIRYYFGHRFIQTAAIPTCPFKIFD